MILQTRIQLTEAQLRSKLQRCNLQTIIWDSSDVQSILKQAFENFKSESESEMWSEVRDALHLPSTDNDRAVVLNKIRKLINVK